MNADLLPLALAAALYPILLAAAVVMLRAPRPTPILVGYLVGGMAISVGIGLVIVFVLGASEVDTSSSGTVSPTVDLVAGGLLILLAILMISGHDRRLRRRRQTPNKTKGGDSWTQRQLSRASARTAVLVGMCLSLPSIYYLTALKDIAGDNEATGVQVGLILAFNLVAFTLIEVPLVCFLVAPERTRVAVTRSNEWVSGHTRQIGEGAALVVGIYLVARGASTLWG